MELSHVPKIISETITPKHKSDEPITKFFIVQGPVKFSIGEGDAVTDLCRVMGAGRFINDGGAIDKLTDTAFINFAEVNGFPVTPFDRDKLRPLLNGVVQNAWYEHFEKSVPESCVVNQQKRVEKYLREYNVAPREPKKPRDNSHLKKFQFGGGSTVNRSYRINPKLKSDQFSGQQLVLFRWFEKHTEGTRVAIVRDLEADGFRANQPVDRVVAYYLNEWKKKGYLTLIGEQTSIDDKAPAADKPKSQEKKSQSKPKAKSKKGGDRAAAAAS